MRFKSLNTHRVSNKQTTDRSNKKKNPKIDRSKLNIDRSRPFIDRPKPNIDRSRPNIDRSRPNIDRARPNIDRPTPNIDRCKPNIDRARPNIDRSSPNIDRRRPNIDRSKPNIDHSKSQKAAALSAAIWGRDPIFFSCACGGLGKVYLYLEVKTPRPTVKTFSRFLHFYVFFLLLGRGAKNK
jgi:hypothetical protein